METAYLPPQHVAVRRWPAEDAMDPSDPQTLLGRAGLKHPCDLDLLLFFHRHPASIMPSEHLAVFAGYDLAQVARSLDMLVGAGVLRRSVNPTHIGRLYYFTTSSTNDWLQPLIASASTPDG